MYKERLPNDQLALVFSIVSIVLLFLGCCCGLFAIVSLGLGIAAVAIAAKSLTLWKQNPEAYLDSSKNNLTAGKIMGIIGIVLSGIVLLIQIGYFALMGTMATSESWQNFWRKMKDDRKKERIYEESIDSIYAPETDADSIGIDSVIIEKKQIEDVKRS